MATITGLTAARMLEIEAASVVSGEIVGDDLILTKFDDSTINAGDVRGPQGPQGNAGLLSGTIPGEVKLWTGVAVPDSLTYGLWVFADGAAYLAADHPVAAANISSAWKTFNGASDPGAGYFRVPDLRGLVPAGMDAMPGGASANRMVRASADSLAGVTGEETHVLTELEMPSHDHDFVDPGHTHPISRGVRPIDGGDRHLSGTVEDVGSQDDLRATDSATTGITINASGSDDAHENVQPTVFVPYIVCLDG